MNKHPDVTGFSGNEIFFLNELGLNAGTFRLGNRVASIGVGGSFKAALRGAAGGEVGQVTAAIQAGRKAALERTQSKLEIVVSGSTAENKKKL